MNKQQCIYLLAVAFLITGCTLPSSSTPTIPPFFLPSPVTKTAWTAATPTETVTPAPTATSTTIPLTYRVVDTAQGKCYNHLVEIPCPSNQPFLGQDAQYTGLEPNFTQNNDGTITDNNTGLIWQQSPDVDGNGIINAADKLTYAAANSYCQHLSLGGTTGWRLPDIKKLYSLIDFRGTDPSGASGQLGLVPFIDNAFFGFNYGDTASGERTIDSQFLSSTRYVDTSASKNGKLFGVNFADGRIKGYDLTLPNGAEKKFYVLCVRPNSTYGVNHFVDNGDGSITDQATGLIWQKDDSGQGLTWQDALDYCENLQLAGLEDWRLPDAKALQSLVDYSRSPGTTNSPAIDPLFGSTSMTNEAGQADYPYYWTSTTHSDWRGKGEAAVYIAFGRAMGYVNNNWTDVHGAGAQRSDPKQGNSADFPKGRGPQGDAIRILNFARCVRGGFDKLTLEGNPSSTRPPLRVKVVETQTAPILEINMPPQVAIQACSSSTVGQACQFTILGAPIYGICQEISIPELISVLTCVATLPAP